MEESDSWDCSFKGHTETRSLSDPLCSFRCTGLLMCCSSVVKSGVTDHIFGCISVINSTFLIESIFRLRLYVCTGMTIYLYGHFYSLNLVILLFFQHLITFTVPHYAFMVKAESQHPSGILSLTVLDITLNIFWFCLILTQSNKYIFIAGLLHLVALCCISN